MLYLRCNSTRPLKTHQYDAKNRNSILTQQMKKKIIKRCDRLVVKLSCVLTENYNKQIFQQ